MVSCRSLGPHGPRKGGEALEMKDLALFALLAL